MIFVDAAYIKGEAHFFLDDKGARKWVKDPYQAIVEAVSRKYTLEAKYTHGTAKGTAKARFEHKEDVLNWMKTFKSGQLFTFNGEGELLSKDGVIERLEASIKPTCSRCKHSKKFVVDGEHREHRIYCACKAPSKPSTIDKLHAAIDVEEFYNKGWRKTHTDCKGVNFEPK